MQPARADVLNRRIDLRGNARQRRHSVFMKLQLDTFRSQQCTILLNKAAFWLGQYSAKVFFAQRLQLDSDRQPSLQLRQQVRWLRNMKRSRRNEQDVIGFHRSVL